MNNGENNCLSGFEENREKKYTGKSSELLVSYNVTDENKEYTFDNIVFGYIENGKKDIVISDYGSIELSPQEVVLGVKALSAAVRLPDVTKNNPAFCFSLEISKEQVWKILDKLNQNYNVSDRVFEEQALSDINLFSGFGSDMVLHTLRQIQHLLTKDLRYKDYWIDIKIEELILSCLQTDMYHSLMNSYKKEHVGENPLAMAVYFIKNNIYDNIDLDKLASKSCMSRATFFRQFKHRLGMTPGQYIHKEKVDEAKNLLLHTDQSITSISSSLNYSSSSYFTKCFTEIEKISPSQFRETICKQ